MALLLVQFLCLFRPSALGWDGAFYYVYTRSSICDGDLRLGNDLVLLYDASQDPYFESEHFEEVLTPTGRVDNPFAVGTSLLWLPWFALIYGLARLAGWVGVGSATLTCYEWPFTWGMGAVTCVYGWIGVLVGFRLARKLMSDWAALAASAVVMFTTPLLYYQFREPFYAHAASAMTVALFVYAWWRSANRRNSGFASSLFLGMLGGLAALVRSQNVAYLVLPILTVLISGWPALRDRDWWAVWRALRHILLVGLGALLILTLQFSVWYIFYGRPLVVPQGAAFMDWGAPWVQHVLFSTFHGLLPWMPLTLPAVVGLVLLARRNPKLAIPLLVAFLLQVYVNSCVRDWFGGGGYGARRFSNALVILLIGYASLLDWRRERWYRLSAIGLSGLLVLHQWFILSYGLADRIGGYVVSMGPAYEWDADGIVHFVCQLADYFPLAVQSPIRTLILSGSPLEAAWTAPVSFAGQILLLAGVLGVLYSLRWGRRWLVRRYVNSLPARYLLLVWIMVIIVLANWWLLKWA